MLNLKFLPVHFSFSLILGIVLGYNYNIQQTLIFIAIFIAFLLLVYFYFKARSSFKAPIFYILITAILFILIGILSINIRNPKYQKRHYSHIYLPQDPLALRVNKVLKTSNYYQKFEASILQVNNIRVEGKVLININKSNNIKPLKVDDIIFTKTNLKELNKALNPKDFDYQKYLKKHGIYHQLKLERKEFLILKSRYNTFGGHAFILRGKINKELLKYNFSVEELAIINALLLGQRNDISKELFEKYKNAGAIHILAVSGLHIGIILLILNFLLKPFDQLKYGKSIKLILIVLSLWFYAIIAGLSASIIRAVTMFTAIAIGLVSNRSNGIENSLVVSIFILLLINPVFLFDIGFQLSYIAVFSIIWIHPILKNIWNPKSKLVNYFWQLLTISFSAQLGILPLSLFYFHQFPGLFFISSLVIIPFLGLILGLGLFVMILALMQFLPSILADIYGMIIQLMNYFVAFISQQESFIFKNVSFSSILMITVYLFLICAIKWFYNRTINNIYLVLIAVCIIQITMIYESIQVNQTNEFIIFHQVKKSILGNRSGKKLKVYHNLDSLKILKNRTLNSYKSSFKLFKTKQVPLKINILKINEKNILIVDSVGVFNNLPFKADIVILIQSPKINLERLIQNIHPKTIIADGSNYKSYLGAWKKTCVEKEISFHNTAINGAFEYFY